MSSSIYNIPNFSAFSIHRHSRNLLSESESDINIFVKEYKDRVEKQLIQGEEHEKSLVSFADTIIPEPEHDEEWLRDNYNRFFHYTPNLDLSKVHFLTEMGFICSMTFAPDGAFLIVGHSSGLIQMRHGITGTVLCTLRNIQFPPKPVYALEYSRLEDRVCYAACMDGAVYRIEIPNISISNEDDVMFCIRADPGLESLNMQFYGSPGISSYSTPFVTQRSPALSLGITADQSRLVVGYGDASIKIYDMETQEAETTYKVHKLRLQFIPKKLQRMHTGQVCAVRCHDQKPTMFASAAWDNTLRIWDTRCKVGCVMTFEGVDICSDSIDLNRDHCIAGSWQPTEALCVWDLVARKKQNIIRVQNRRPDVDGEYIYACRYWKSTQYNRKGKYCIVGGSGTKCVEVINLHNRYIACSYPAAGTVLAVTSHEERIAFGGTTPVFNIVTFHDPKHEKYEMPQGEVNVKSMTLFHDDSESMYSDYDPTEQSKVAVPSVLPAPTDNKILSKNDDN
ncbi:unnamed protein product [Chilo suppressalis]|uniref:Uncharacterized protein n=1 Tax=Chilo suppressalis TaxID=168631 RepID=A0ABN8BA70_CHISP|nr:unnamed protein product [Chilo suppressalis]